MSFDPSRESSASRALLLAALGGLLGACAPAAPRPTGGDDGSVTDAGTVPEASIACEAGVSDAPSITSSNVDPSVTLDSFTSESEQRGGAVEVEPHCGGENSCRGISWDTGTETVTEHTCRGMNTCAGYSCVICDDESPDQ